MSCNTDWLSARNHWFRYFISYDWAFHDSYNNFWLYFNVRLNLTSTEHVWQAMIFARFWPSLSNEMQYILFHFHTKRKCDPMSGINPPHIDTVTSKMQETLQNIHSFLLTGKVSIRSTRSPLWVKRQWHRTHFHRRSISIHDIEWIAKIVVYRCHCCLRYARPIDFSKITSATSASAPAELTFSEIQ